eukprot:CAMPEP_0201722312 /NCGR_PEP_ID=MMETSP0593-20130828/6724_1 /ASSEMBLY_ACC=CAM_ASM_000672 /TAXON_ID=267983 /ORGANISM="Skeletonema japonicum, Strain CCMP2506" /LENGTH=551 /DNA_ID=CAMNT_0048213247 /DNA_START=14 /DNA_END=1669 /DNA_ORIENTATION=+
MTADQDIWLLITAHPDDESMFFTPTLRNLIHLDSKNERHNQKPNIQLLCLSNGDYRDVSDGPVRTKELYKACSLIGIDGHKTSDTASVIVLDDDRLKDGPNEVWNSDLIANTVLEHIQTILSSIQKQQSTQPQLNINIITFDQGGVSGHPNHVDAFRGITHFLHEKCHVVRGDDEKLLTRLKLTQQASSTVTNGQDSSNHTEINLRVLALKTISNPLHKYFLWIFVELLPALLIWLLQVLLYTIYLLLGGFLLNKNNIRSKSFSRMIPTSDGKQLRCRLFDPVLVWMAMAAHSSQFVWYRRLSVLFSRYTYLNDLYELEIDPSLLSEEEEDEDAFPPVKTIQEDTSSPKFLLSNGQMVALREAVLPIGLHHRPWKRIYSLSRDGDSFVSFEKHITNWNAKFGDSSTLLVVKTTKGEVIGGYADAIATSSPRPGTARSCLFRAEKDDTFTVYDGKQNSLGTFFEGSPHRMKSGGIEGSSKKILLDSTRRIIAFGGGLGMKSGDGFGLCLEDGFARGTTARCEAFCNEPLVEGNGGVFDVLDVEVYGFVFGQF